MEKNTPWIGVDLDGTLAEWHGWDGVLGSIGKPVPKMVYRVKEWLRTGKRVKIFTARVACSGYKSEISVDNEEFADLQREQIKKWCIEHIGQELEITAIKDYAMVELYDDRAIQVRQNTGELVE